MNRTIRKSSAALSLLAALFAAHTVFPADWSSVDAVLGSGKDLPGGVHRYGWPRRDLAVTRDGVKLEPALALGSWAAFVPAPSGAMTMGDLVLTEAEVDPTVKALQAGSLQVLAIHNHLLGESPRIAYVHFSGHGEAAALAKSLKGALEKTKTPLGAAKPAETSAAEKELFKKVEAALGRTGTATGHVLAVGFARAEPIVENGMEVPASAGMSTAMNFQAAGQGVATTGDFVLIASEVNPVVRELQAHGVEVTAIHSHMLEETPRLFFLHFWGVGTPDHIGGALKAALAKVRTK